MVNNKSEISRTETSNKASVTKKKATIGYRSSSSNLSRMMNASLRTQSSVSNSVRTPDTISASSSTSSTNQALNFDHSKIHGRQKERSVLETAVRCMIPGRSKDCTKQTTTHHTHDDKNDDEPTHQDEPPPNLTKNDTESLVTKETKSKQLVLISGYSGTGKSVLAHSIQHIIENEMGGTFVTGKFDQCLGGGNTTTTTIMGNSDQQQRQQQPYTAFRMICDGLVRQVVAMKMDTQGSTSRKLFEDLKDQLMMELGIELMDLIQVFPSLDGLLSSTGHQQTLGDSSDHINTFTSSTTPLDASYRQQKNALRTVNNESLFRFKFMFGILFRIIATILSPLVLVIDDLQWADSASLDLMESLLSNSEIKNLMVIGIYRSNEVDETHLFAKTLQDIRSASSNDDDNKDDLSIIEMEIGDLDREAVHEMLSSLLSMSSPEEKERIRPLAKVCYKKTAGNPFYLTHFISRLHEMRMLKYNHDMMEWIWEGRRIELYTEATDNVVDLLKQTMTSLSPIHQTLLKFAAFLGSTFEERPMLVLWKDFTANVSIDLSERTKKRRRRRRSKDDTSVGEGARVGKEEGKGCPMSSEFGQVMKSCQKAGFWEHSEGEQTYRWVHDKLQEAAMDLVGPKEQRDFSQYLAEVLASQLTEKELESLMFVLVDRFNGGNIPRKRSKRIELAKMNLQAAEKSVSYSAFESAASYCKYGIRLLPMDCWERDYGLSLSLYSLGAETEGFLGRIHMMEEYCKVVLRQKEVVIGAGGGTTSSFRIFAKGRIPKIGDGRRGGVRDKVRVYNVMIMSMGNRNLPNEAIDLCLDVLGQYGVRLPKAKMGITCQIGMGIMRLKSILKSYSASDIESLPMMDDPIRIEQMGMLSRVSTCCYMAESDMFPLITFKMLSLTLEHGCCKFSSVSFAICGLILCGVLGDLGGGRLCAKYALILLNKLDRAEMREVESKTMLFAYGFALHWASPLKSMIQPGLRGYEVGMQSGDTESATYNLCHYFMSTYACGVKLEAIERDSQRFIPQMKKLKQDVATNFCCVIWQAVLNLMGRSQFKTRLTGKALKEDICREEMKENASVSGNLYVSKVILCSFYGDYGSAVEYSYKDGDSPLKKIPGMALIPLYTFHRCLSLVARARILKRQKSQNKSVSKQRQRDELNYVKLAQKVLDKIKNWIKQENPQSRHYEPLLEAELAAYEGQSKMAVEKYEKAIDMAAEDEFIQDVALANERYGMYLLTQCNDVGDDDDDTNKGTPRREGEEEEKQEVPSTRTEGIFRLEESIRWYREWGADGKVKAMEEQYQHLLQEKNC